MFFAWLRSQVRQLEVSQTFQRILWIVPFGWYVPVTAGLVIHYTVPGDAPGYDGWLYRQAAVAFLSGHDPWATGVAGAHFAGAPSTILAFIPATLVPADVWRPSAVLGMLLVGAWMARRLEISIAWLAYPPLAVGVLLGQPGVLVAGLLLGRSAALAPVIKPWAGFVLGFWPRRAIVAAGIGLITVAVAPDLWLRWIERLPELSARLSSELHGSLPLWVPAVGGVALIVIWRIRPAQAPWLAVSALWPYPEFHNAIVAMPTRLPLLLFGLALVPGPLVVVAYALWLLGNDFLHRWPHGDATGKGV